MYQQPCKSFTHYFMKSLQQFHETILRGVFHFIKRKRLLERRKTSPKAKKIMVANNDSLSLSIYVCVCVYIYIYIYIYIYCVYMKSESVSHSVMSDSLEPMDCSPTGSYAHGILQARILEWVATPFSRGPSQV